MTLVLTVHQKWQIKMVMLTILLMQYHNSIRERTYLLRAAVVHPSVSPWRYLYEHGDDGSFLHLTGLTREAFTILHNILFPPEPPDEFGRRPPGRPKILDSYSSLGLLLFYIGSTMTFKHLCLIFGILPSQCSFYIEDMLLLATNKLCDHPLSSVRFPDAGKMEQFAAMINAREPLVDDVIGFMDGVSIPTECTAEENEQNAMYDGYTCDTTVNNVLAYGPDGKVFLSALNFPGSWTDGKLSAHFIEFIKRKIGRYKICVDQGFPRQGEAYGILVGPISRRTARGLHRDVRDYLLKISNIHTSLRQASEWGMRGLQGSFPRLKKRLPSDKTRRRLVLEAIVFVHNLRTDIVGKNQIKTVFDIEYERIHAVEGYDRIRRYYFQPGDYDTDNDDDDDDSVMILDDDGDTDTE